MIDREQVHHVARLARLRLDDSETERMSSELSGILDHVEAMERLELGDVEPTARVVDLENVLRPDVETPSLPRETALADAPDSTSDSFRVPSPQA